MQKIGIHIAATLVLFGLFLILFFYVYLPSTTLHGDHIAVPDWKGKSWDEVKKLAEENNLNVFIYDSVYQEDKPVHVVLDQTPEAGTLVKSGRKIYMAISAEKAPQIAMPQLLTYSLKTAEMVLKSYGLKLGKISYQANANQNVILKQMYQGKNILAGDMLFQGSVIDLLVSKGLVDSLITVPHLLGLPLSQAQQLLESSGLELGSVSYDEIIDGPRGIVFRQKPISSQEDSSSNIQMGEIVDIWISGPKPTPIPKL